MAIKNRIFQNDILNFRLSASIILCLFGLIIIDDESAVWEFGTIGLFSLPLVFYFTRFLLAQVYLLWFGIAMLIQAVLTPILFSEGAEYITLPPNMERVVEVQEDALPGIRGMQTITTDHRGFRVTHEIDYENKKGFRIFVIGGSTSEQIFLDDRRTWTHLLQEELEDYLHGRVEVINTGVSGLRARHHLATFNRIIEFSPDMVILLLGINDWNRHIKIKFKQGTAKSLKTTYRSMVRPILLRNSMFGIFSSNVLVKVSALGADEHEVQVETGEGYAQWNHSLARHEKYEFKPKSVSGDYRYYVKELMGACRSNPVLCVFVSQPTGYHPDARADIKERFWMTPPYRNYTIGFESLIYLAGLYNDYLRQESERYGQAFCDLVESIEPSLENFYDDSHFNEGGARNVSKYLFSCIADLVDGEIAAQFD